jgi:single-strand DNA-binding protein
MSSLNKVMLIGRLGKDPEIRYTAENTPVANFTLATSETYTKNGEKVEQTEWHNIVVWRSLAEIAQKYLHKGKQVFVEGKIRTRSYDDKDGNKRYMTEIIADNLTMLGSREDGGSQEGGNGNGYQSSAPRQQSAAPQPTPQVPMDDDLPF